MNERFPQYTTGYISGVMSLRKPQEKSLEILDSILERVELKKNADLEKDLSAIHEMFPICTDFERNFLSLTFALATGVGKTRLMGAFITYLYTQKNIRNFFVVAPSTTIYRKLMSDLGDMSSEKYVFRGLGCFIDPPAIISEEAYKEMTGSLIKSDIRIFVFNIDKFNKEDANMKKVNEFIGSSFYEYVSGLEDLVILMDESHHYRANKGLDAINGLKPVLGLELTATPMVSKGGKTILFKNVVYEYPLSKAIEDGYTRTPYVMTRSDINFYNFGEQQLDRLMLNDGILAHERTKKKLEEYAANHSKRKIKPFMLVVCKDTDHAKEVEDYIKSDDFKGGAYRNKTIIVHSKQKGAETEANTQMLLQVERSDNPVEIVIHVNMLKEGWDVNNLYTIVPLRTAASAILREQMVGRGLRLPYGERTGDRDVDAVMLTAHDKFDDIIREAEKGNSIFKAGNVIRVEELEEEEITYAQQSIFLDTDEGLNKAYEETGLERTEYNDRLLKTTGKLIQHKIAETIQKTPDHKVSEERKQEIAREVQKELEQDEDLAARNLSKWGPLGEYIKNQTEEIHREIVNKYIPIPRLKITDEGVEEYVFLDFDIDLSVFNQVPIENEILIQSLEDPRDVSRIKGKDIDFEGYTAEKFILEYLRQKPEIDYEKCSGQLYKHIKSVINHYESKFGTNGMRNIVMMYKREIANRIYDQMMQHFYRKNGFVVEEIVGSRDYNISPAYNASEKVSLFAEYYKNIKSVLFEDIKKGVFSEAKFDSEPELTLARVLERDDDVKNWLRPAPNEFNITYNHGHSYQPDFVVETDDMVFLVEVKGENMLTDPDVIAKKERAMEYCSAASRWGKANGYKNWQYLFIPSKQVTGSSSFRRLAEQFKTL